MFGRKRRTLARAESIVGQQTRIVGDISFVGRLHIDGTVDGNVRALGEDNAVLTVSDSATINGEVRVPFIILNGTVVGDVYAREQVELAPKARVEGDVHYALIEMAMGAEVNGKLLRIVDPDRVPLTLNDRSVETAQ
ncbi:MAG: polymer-forming cytoskeletal protein [Gammaproteobacteria bacterium]|nr:polymer-forming cytoskeletal protein [Gammaproteobacteria bacterium]